MLFILSKDNVIDWLIDWCLTPTLAVFQLYSGVDKYYINLDTYKTIRNKTYVSIKQTDVYKTNRCL